MSTINIYMCGVGGQGIGLLSEVLSQASLDAGYNVRGCDTHGLAQRGGSVVSQLRLGEDALTPQVPPGSADVVVALERLEGMRAIKTRLKEGGVLFYYDSTYQPIHVRLGLARYPSVEDLEKAVAEKSGTIHRIHVDDLEDPRMQNVALLAKVGARTAIPKIDAAVIREALGKVVPGKILESNLTLFDREAK
jgi:indolepyruvate ferredoxin oxidoreductase, beta subunit